jgi:hypothetical protein
VGQMALPVGRGRTSRLRWQTAFFFPLENSILPSVSVGTPLQVAGRNLQLRTARKTLRSAIAPALSRIRGLLTRPSVPMMKLTLIRLREVCELILKGGIQEYEREGSKYLHRFVERPKEKGK